MRAARTTSARKSAPKQARRSRATVLEDSDDDFTFKSDDEVPSDKLTARAAGKAAPRNPGPKPRQVRAHPEEKPIVSEVRRRHEALLARLEASSSDSEDGVAKQPGKPAPTKRNHARIVDSSSSGGEQEDESESDSGDSYGLNIPVRKGFNARDELAEWDSNATRTPHTSVNSRKQPPVPAFVSKKIEAFVHPVPKSRVQPVSAAIDSIVRTEKAESECIDVVSSDSDGGSVPLPAPSSIRRSLPRFQSQSPLVSVSSLKPPSSDETIEDADGVGPACVSPEDDDVVAHKPRHVVCNIRSEDSVTVDLLAVHKKKIDDVRDWLLSALALSQIVDDVIASTPAMLVLYGPPGCGKSTCVRALAKQLGIHLRQWIDHGNRGTSHSSLKVQSSNAVQPWFADDVDVSTRSAYEVPFTSVLQDFVDFLHQTNVFAPLVLQTNGSSTPKQHRSIVLLEDVPRPRDASGLAKLRHALLQCIRRSGSVVHRCPIVMICSDAGGDQDGTASLSSLERWLSPEVVHHPAVTCLQFNPVNPTLLRKTLSACAPAVPTSAIERIVTECGGDIRHALKCLELEALVTKERDTSKVRKKPAKRSKKSSVDSIVNGFGSDDDRRERSSRHRVSSRKDEFLSTLHALGKLLYAKRDPSGNLECDPDAVMETAPFDATTASSFLSENCPAFFEDITDLAVAMETFSDADVLEGSGWRSRRTTTFPESYVGSIAGRAVIASNQHPTPRTYLQIRRPGCFALRRIREENAQKLTSSALTCGESVLPDNRLPVPVDWFHTEASIASFGPILHALPSRQNALDRIPFSAMIQAPIRRDYTMALLLAAATCAIKLSDSSPRPGDIDACEWVTKAQQLSTQWGNVLVSTKPVASSADDDDPIVE